MNMKKLTQHLYISDAINTNDIAKIAEKGVKTIICNRPDEEEKEQASFSEISSAAQKHHIATIFIPIDISNISRDQIDKMNSALSHSEAPILAYCRSGKRAATMWALGKAIRGEDTASLAQQVRDVGHDVEDILTSYMAKHNVPLSDKKHG